MNKRFFFAGLITVLFFSSLSLKAQDPTGISDIIGTGVKTVIKAFDLQVQRIQTSTIWLQEAQKVIENAMSELHLGEITGWVQKMKDLYGDYFEELWKVKDVIVLYEKAKDVVVKETKIVAAYRQAMSLFQADKHFTVDELQHIEQVYTGMIEESLKNVDQITLVLSAFSTQMSDARRLEIIRDASDNIDKVYRDMMTFSNENALLSIQKVSDENEYNFLRKIYGLQ